MIRRAGEARGHFVIRTGGARHSVNRIACGIHGIGAQLADRDALFEPQEWVPPRDWQRNRGLLAEVRASYLDLEARKKDAAALAPDVVVKSGAPVSVDLPVPQVAASTRTTTKGAPASPAPSPGGGAPIPARPTLIER